MKKIISFILILFVFQANAQKLIGGNHILKTNLSSLALKNYNLTFEKSLNRFMSASISYRYMPKSTIPLKSLAEEFLANSEINFNDFEMGNNALTLETRFYLGLSKMSGFYIAPYARFANFDLTVPVEYTYTPSAPIPGVSLDPVTATAKMEGKIQSQSYGAYIGMQYQLLTKLVLDIWLIGGHYGRSSGQLTFTAPTALPQEAQTALQNSLDNTSTDPFTFKTTVTANGANTDMKGPWAGIRGLGITLGIRF